MTIVSSHFDGIKGKATHRVMCEDCWKFGDPDTTGDVFDGRGNVVDDRMNRMALAAGWTNGRRGAIRTHICPACSPAKEALPPYSTAHDYKGAP